MSSQVTNCYRAILAQVNHLDSIYQPKSHLKELYIDLTELAYCLLEQNEEHAYLGIEQMYKSLEEVGKQVSLNRARQKDIDYILGEIKTHLEFLAMQLHTHPFSTRSTAFHVTSRNISGL